jgi:hypothetical protein
MKDVSYFKMTANQCGRFCEKESFEENIGHGNRSSDTEREAP